MLYNKHCSQAIYEVLNPCKKGSLMGTPRKHTYVPVHLLDGGEECMCRVHDQDASVIVNEPISDLRASEPGAAHEVKQPTHLGKVTVQRKYSYSAPLLDLLCFALQAC